MALRIKLAETAEEHDALFRTRHEIFVEEKRYAHPSADERLLDRFDAFPTTANVIAVAGSDVVGGVRFMRIPSVGSPADPYFDFTRHVPVLARVGSGSLLLMKKEFRAVKGATFAMLAMGYQWALQQGITHVVGLAAPEAEPLFLSMGYRAVAERIPFEGAGETALPVVLDLGRLADPFLDFARRHSAEFLLDSPVRQFNAMGDVVVQRGSRDDAIFVVVSGQASVRLGGRKGIIVEQLAPGDLFGEVALLAGMERTTDVIAETDLELVVVDRARFFSYVEKRPQVAVALLRIVAERLGKANQRTAERASMREMPGAPSSREFIAAGPASSRHFVDPHPSGSTGARRDPGGGQG